MPNVKYLAFGTPNTKKSFLWGVLNPINFDTREQFYSIFGTIQTDVLKKIFISSLFFYYFSFFSLSLFSSFFLCLFLISSYHSLSPFLLLSSTIPALVTNSRPDSAFNTCSSLRQYSEEGGGGGGDWMVGDSRAAKHGNEKMSPKERAPKRVVIMVFLVQLIELLWMVVVVKLERSGDRGFGVSDWDGDDGGSVGKEFERARTLIFWLRRVKWEWGWLRNRIWQSEARRTLLANLKLCLQIWSFARLMAVADLCLSSSIALAADGWLSLVIDWSIGLGFCWRFWVFILFYFIYYLFIYLNFVQVFGFGICWRIRWLWL